MRRTLAVWLAVTLVVVILCSAVRAGETGEQALFAPVSSDAMIVLDLSKSMRFNPRDDHDSSQEPLRRYGNDACSGELFFDAPQPGHATDCARYLIAKRILYRILDGNGDGVIDARDEGGHRARLGFWTFSTTNRRQRDIGQPHAAIWCGGSACSGLEPTVYSGDNTVLYWTDSRQEKQRVAGNTALAGCLEAVKPYLDDHRRADAYRSCRKKFVILVTDGQDTLSCDGSGSSDQPDQYKRRRASVLRVKALRDAGYRVFVIGLGNNNMPAYQQYTLNWMARHGGTENPLAKKSGDPSALNPGAFTSNPCAWSPTSGSCSGSSDQCFAATNDPGAIPLSGYAFLAGNAMELETALRAAMTTIRDASYAFGTPSVSAARTAGEDYLYAASFVPGGADSFWRGTLRKYAIQPDQSPGAVVADAGEALREMPAGQRTILTARGGSLVFFTASNLTPADLGVADRARLEEVVGYIRGDAAHNPERDAAGNVWKLGDIFHSSPVTIGTPSAYFADPRDRSGSFESYRSARMRTSTNGKRIIVAGANDGQLHAFRTSDLREVWSFIPPNLLAGLKDIAHRDHPTALAHRFYVDGPITVADVWTGAGNGKAKSPSQWKTLLVVGLGQGGGASLWSSSPACDSGHRAAYLPGGSHPFYCGYHALDVTDTLAPVYRWSIRPAASQAPYLGDPWSRMVIRRVRIGADERWVGIVGGGHNVSPCAAPADCSARGKGLFVIDAVTGQVLWSFNRFSPGGGAMTHALPAPAAVIDSDMDGFADRAYTGDLGGNIWRFSFCRASDGDVCTTADWKGSLFFQRDGATGPVYHAPAVSRDSSGDLWVYWGTGDGLQPLAAATNRDWFYGVRDLGREMPRTSSHLQNISGAAQSFADRGVKDGWYVVLGGRGEKILASPTVFGGVVYFTTYTPESGGDPCEQAGTARLYGLSCTDGTGALAGGSRQRVLGKGIPSSPMISGGSKPGTGGMFGSVSGGSNAGAGLWKGPPTLKWPERRTHLLQWRDGRIR